MNREDAERLRRIYAADIDAERALADDLHRFVVEARSALLAATVIGMRSCRSGDGLDYGNQERLVVVADELLARYRKARERV